MFCSEGLLNPDFLNNAIQAGVSLCSMVCRVPAPAVHGWKMQSQLPVKGCTVPCVLNCRIVSFFVPNVHASSC